ncbi:MAG: hypothetical protein U0636_03550 [Phycisphaerales bacterium]
MRTPSIKQTQELCKRRARRQPDLGIAGAVQAMARAFRQAEKRTAGAAEAWQQVLPAELVQNTWIESVTPQQLTVGVESSAAAFQVDRALREGALVALRQALQRPAFRVRTRVGRRPGA